MANNELVTVFGGGGFLGRYVTQELLRMGWRVRVAERNPGDAVRIKPLGGLGQTQLVAADVTRPESVARAVVGSSVVINLVGVLKGDFDRVHHLGAAHVAQAAKDAGARVLVHVSALGADADSPSAYGRSKAAGERAVLSAFPSATIMRPSIIFGREDQFLNRFAGLIRALPIVPVIGGATRFQPVYVVDVARAIAAAVQDPVRCGGKVFALGGPQVLSMAQINQWVAERIGHVPAFAPLPDSVSSMLAMLTGWAPGAPITRDQWAMLQKDNVVESGDDGLAALDIAPTPMAAVADAWLMQYRRHGRFADRVKA
jgi:uncharacterized protein YbjT (DUF2867 family)